MKNPRTPLTRVLQDAWKIVIKNHYNKGESSPDINSEAALQAYYFNEIRRQLLHAEEIEEINPGVRVFVEPNFKVKEQIITPDLILCRNGEVISFVEIKYLPRFKNKIEKQIHAGFKKDINSLRSLHEASKENTIIQFQHERYLGQCSLEKESFSISRTTLFVWAAIYSLSADSGADWLSVDDGIKTEQPMPLLQIHTITTEGNEARTEFRFG